MVVEHGVWRAVFGASSHGHLRADWSSGWRAKLQNPLEAASLPGPWTAGAGEGVEWR